jgi:hypothetical protein
MSIHLEYPPPSPLIVAIGRTTANGNAGGTTIVDTNITAPISGGMTLVIYVDDPNNIEAREIASEAGGTITVHRAFSAQVPPGVYYMVLSILTADDRIGQNNNNNAFDSSAVTANRDGSVLERLEQIQDSVDAIVGLSITENNTAALDLTSEQDIISLSPAALTEVSGVLVSMNNCSVGATVTVRVYRFVNGTERQIDEITAVRGTDPDGIVAVGSFIPIPSGAATFRVTMQSDDVGDTAVVVPYSYVTRTMT